MWRLSTHSNLIIQIHNRNPSQDEDSLSDLPRLPSEETLESQEEYPWEVVEVEDSQEAAEEVEVIQEDLQQHHKGQVILETNSSVTHHPYSQGTE